MNQQEARQWVIDGLTSCIPKGCPISCTVISAKAIKKQTVVAEVRMFDGLPGTVEVSRVPFLCIFWKDLPGGPCYLNGTKWERVNKTSVPQQLELELSA